MGWVDFKQDGRSRMVEREWVGVESSSCMCVCHCEKYCRVFIASCSPEIVLATRKFRQSVPSPAVPRGVVGGGPYHSRKFSFTL